jgi:inner centromere protein
LYFTLHKFLSVIYGRKLISKIDSQAFKPPDVDAIFIVAEATPDLNEIFTKKRQRFNKRTSSAVWDTAPSTHKW